jgi:hypothetical protein
MNINGDIYWALLIFMRAQETEESQAKSKKLRIEEYKEERKIKRRKPKQRTAMKLYTEEQVLEIIANINRDVNVSSQELLEGIEVDHIELPSDDEIKKMMELDGMEFDEFDPYDVSYLGGATWMRNKIQGGDR